MIKIISLVITLAGLTVCPVLAADQNIPWGPLTNQAQIAITIKDDLKELKLNQPLILKVHFRNISSNYSIKMMEEGRIELTKGYDFVVIAPSGKNIFPNREGLTWVGKVRYILPAQTVSFEYNLNYHCRFDRPGTYKISLVRRGMVSHEAGQEFSLASNELRLKVSSEKWKPEEETDK